MLRRTTVFRAGVFRTTPPLLTASPTQLLRCAARPPGTSAAAAAAQGATAGAARPTPPSPPPAGTGNSAAAGAGATDTDTGAGAAANLGASVVRPLNAGGGGGASSLGFRVGGSDGKNASINNAGDGSAVIRAHGGNMSAISSNAGGGGEKRLSTFGSTAPVLAAENFGSNRGSIALALLEEERRIARNKDMFEDLLDFQGGAIADHENFGKRMMMRDFVQHGLYHYKWGYHPKLQRKYRGLMTSGLFDPIPFAALRNKWDYEAYVSKITDASPTYVSPPSLFQPFYGWVMAEYMISVMRAKFDPTEPLIIYEVGAFNGALAVTVLNFLAEQYPDVYDKCEYHCIELSADMVRIQRAKLVHHMHHVKLHHISIFNWREVDPRRCFVLGVEVMSSMPHDCIVYSDDHAVYQNYINFLNSDNLATAEERWERCSDPMILRYLRYAEFMREETFNSLKVLCLTDGKVNDDPAKWNSIEPSAYDSHMTIVLKSLNVHNPYRIVWIPTGQMVMMETLSQFFPRHHAFFSDWSSVQNPIMGINGPVVQAKLRVGQDWFVRRVAPDFHQNAGMVDACFPTDFDHLTTMYRNVCGHHKEVTNITHPDFWKTFGGEKTALFQAANGYNPLLEDFETFSIFASHHPSEM